MDESYDYYYEKYGLGQHINGPSEIFITRQAVYLKSNGQYHRKDGPCVYFKTTEFKHDPLWCINGECINDWAEAVGIDLYNMSTEDLALIELTWG